MQIELNSMRVMSVLVLVLLAFGWFVVIRPESLGGATGYILVSGHSMEPTFYTGDLVVTRKQANYSPGDIIAYRIPEGDESAGKKVIHRVIGGNGVEGYDTQGDNNSWVDIWHPTNSDVVGKKLIYVAGGQKYVDAVRAPQAFAAFSMFIVSLGLFSARKTRLHRRSGPAFVTRLL